jgi:protein-S-isoprenylcysteine O-methyltransferase Ste14
MTTRAGQGEASAGTGSQRETAAVRKSGPFMGRRLKLLIGSGDKIGLFTLPFVLAGLLLNIIFPSAFDVGGPPTALQAASIVVLIPGLTIWIWSAALILRKVPRGELITNGPYSIVKHPLYTGVALLVLPWIGFLFNTWLGAAIGIILYIGSRIFAPAEEAELSKTFGVTWDEYCNAVKVPWL